MARLTTTCQHHRIDNTTLACSACGEQMIGVTVIAKTVLSAPNLTPCTKPAHLAALARGEDVDCCAAYTPGRAQEVIVGYDPAYECQRCGQGGSVAAGEPFVPPCGDDHRGNLIRSKVRT